jgi:hypothetical protein
MQSRMQQIEPITFIIPVGNETTYERCFLSSPLFIEECNRDLKFQIIPQRGFKNGSAAFNDGLDRAENDLIVCCHQDVILPVMWADWVSSQVRELERQGVPLGVVGCMGSDFEGTLVGHVYHRDRQMLEHEPLPARVQTLDELLIAFRKSSGMRFDANLPQFFGYAPDLCMEAHMRGLQNFALNAPCIHETADRRLARRDIYPTWSFLQNKWKKFLPVHTPTVSIDGRRWPYVKDMIKDYVFHYTGYTPRPWWMDIPQVKRGDVLYAGCTVEQHQ